MQYEDMTREELAAELARRDEELFESRRLRCDASLGDTGMS